MAEQKIEALEDLCKFFGDRIDRAESAAEYKFYCEVYLSVYCQIGFVYDAIK